MNVRTRNCPECNRPIYKYAQICPYCKCETMFPSVDEEADMLAGEEQVPPAEEPPVEPAVAAPEEPQETDAGADSDAEAPVIEDQHPGYIDQLKRETEVVKKEFDEKIGKRFSKSTIFIGTVITILALIVLGLYIAVRMMEKETLSLSDQVDNSLKEVVDSMEMELYQSSTIVAKFPDKKRHCLIYLNDGKLCVFDANTRRDSVINLTNLNSKALVDYQGSGVLSAYFTPNEHYIVIVAARNAGNTEFGLYRLSVDDMSLEVVDKGKVTHEKDGYVVSTNLRQATYDANGDRLSGLSGANGEPVVPTPTKPEEKPKAQTERREESSQPKVEAAPKQEIIIPKADIVPKPNVSELQEKIEIKPVKPVGE